MFCTASAHSLAKFSANGGKLVKELEKFEILKNYVWGGVSVFVMNRREFGSYLVRDHRCHAIKMLGFGGGDRASSFFCDAPTARSWDTKVGQMPKTYTPVNI